MDHHGWRRRRLLVQELTATLRDELADMPSPDEDLKPLSRMVVLLDSRTA